MRTTLPIACTLCLLVSACGGASGEPDLAEQEGSGGSVPGSGGAAGKATSDAGAKAGGSTGSGGAKSGAGGMGGSDAGAKAGGSTGSGGAREAGVSAKCTTPVGPGLPPGAPQLQAGVWKNISPTSLDWGNGPFTQGMAVDPCNPAVLYVTSDAFDVSLGGLFKSTDAGSSWARIGLVDGGNNLIDEPIRVRINPKNTQHLYVGDGVRGGTMGFWISTDGGETWTMPQSFRDLSTDPKLFPYDVYDVAVDPTDFDHVLVAFHGAWGWTDTKWNTSSGVLETKDGGATWIVHEPVSGWGTGHAITFLYRPDLGVGDARTWLLGTQGNGMWRTTDAGATWTKVSTNGIQHGGGTVYYTAAGVLFASGADRNMRSTDNGATWTSVGPGGGYNGIGGDGKNIYSAKCFGPTHMLTTAESDGVTWKDYGTQEFGSGPFEMGFDSVNGILYTASWGDGMWALKTQ